MTPVLTVLVVSGGGYQGLGLVKALRESPRIRIVLADSHRDNVTRHFTDRAYTVPEIARPSDFVAALLEICAGEGVGLVMPSTGYELLILAETRERFREKGVPVAVSGAPFLALVGDKRALYARLKQAGLPVLPVVDAGQGAIPFPVIAKPASGWGSRGVEILRTQADLESHRALADTHVFQPYLEGAEELSADLAIDFRGVASSIALRRRVRTSGGFAVISETVSHPAAEAAVAAFVDLARGLGALGVLNVQALTRGPEAYLSDVNARPGTSATHWCGTGFNPALHVCASVLPEVRVEGTPARVHRRSVRYLEELRLDPEGGRSAGVRGVVFDLDDTLVPHKRWIADKLEALHAAEAAELPERDVFLREAQRLVEEGHRSRLFDELAAAFGFGAALRDRLIVAYRAIRPAECAVFPDVLPTLATLKRAGLKLSVLTDNPPASQRAKLESSPLPELLDAVVYARETGAEKPDSRGFVEVASRLGIEPASLAMVGDNPYRDVLGAARAGFGRAFLVRREGALVSFDAALFRRLPGSPQEFVELDGLQSLARLLG